MKYKKGLIFIMLIICLFSIASVCASDINDTLAASNNQNDGLIEIENQEVIENSDVNDTVAAGENKITIDDENNDVLAVEYQEDIGATEENELSASAGNFTDLANDIANAENELNLTRDYVYSSNYKSGITINKKITINGNGHTINGNNQASAFEISRHNVILNDINFVNCSSSRGAVYLYDDSSCSFVGCSFVNCSSRNYGGGAIYFDNEFNDLIVVDCRFINNTANVDGGAIWYKGNNCHILNSSFADNSNGYGYGGAVYFKSGDSVVFNSSFVNNYAEYGGAIYCHGINVNVSDSIFVNNSAVMEDGGAGGAIYFSCNNAVVFNCIFMNNSARLALYSNRGSGGAIYLYCNSTVSNCSFVNNYANRKGGAIFVYEHNSTISNCSFMNNYVISEYDARGGAICWDDCSDGSVLDCIFVDNAVYTDVNSRDYGYGGAICWDGCSEGSVLDCIFVNNNGIVLNRYAPYIYGGAVHLLGKNFTFSRCDFVNNNVVGGFGGAISIENDYIYIAENNKYFAMFASCTFDECSFVDCFVTRDGGAIYFNYYDEIARQSYVVKPIYIVYGDLIMNNCDFVNCSAARDGGAIYRRGNNTFLDNCSFVNCYSNNDGGAIYFGQYNFINQTYECYNSTIKGCMFLNCSAGECGGAIYSNSTGIYCRNSNFTNNSASRGEAICGGNAVNCMFTDNDAYECNTMDCKFEGSSFIPSGVETNTTVLVDPKITASNLNMFYNDGSYFKVQVHGTDGNVAVGESVVFKLDGKMLKTVKTDANGYAKVKITSLPKTYKITITALGKSVTKTITVKHLLTLKTAKVKKSAKKLVLKATLAKVNGKYLKNKKITFKFNGKKYTVKTNKKGVAKVTIPKKVLKKLKAGKKVKYQATYLKDTVAKTVKVKK